MRHRKHGKNCGSAHAIMCKKMNQLVLIENCRIIAAGEFL